VHFFVGDLGPAEAFYHRGLGLERRIWSWPGALFMAAGGYHHHVGVNTWAAGAPVASDDDAKLIEWTLEVPADEDVAAVSRSLTEVGQRVEPAGEHAVRATDAWGIVARVVSKRA
jgi:catechol 2,3-dioxygenase